MFQRQTNFVRWPLLLALMLWLGVLCLGLAHKGGFAQWSRTLLVGLYSASLATLLILALCKQDSGVTRLRDVPLRMLLALPHAPGAGTTNVGPFKARTMDKALTPAM